MNQLVDSIPALKDAVGKLPNPYKSIDEDFLSEHKNAIEEMKLHFVGKGGLHLLDVGEDRKIICRVPNKTQVEETLEKSRKEKQTDVAHRLVGQCCLYPPTEVLNEWAQDSPGIFLPLSNKLLELTATIKEVTAKKL